MERIPHDPDEQGKSRESKENLVLGQLGLLFFFFFNYLIYCEKLYFFHRIYQAYRPGFRSTAIGTLVVQHSVLQNSARDQASGANGRYALYSSSEGRGKEETYPCSFFCNYLLRRIAVPCTSWGTTGRAPPSEWVGSTGIRGSHHFVAVEKGVGESVKRRTEQAVCNQKEAPNRVAMVSQSRVAKRCVRLKTLPPRFTNDQLPKAALGGRGGVVIPLGR